MFSLILCMFLSALQKNSMQETFLPQETLVSTNKFLDYVFKLRTN